jgi:murein endopeptidase
LLVPLLTTALVVTSMATTQPAPAHSPAPPGATEPPQIPVSGPSRAVGLPHRGRLENGLRLAPGGETFFTWDPVLRQPPNRWWRRYATDRLLATLGTVLSEFHADHPDVRVGIGDLSRPYGGDFGPEWGSIGHASHQNGLDADVYYPRLDRRERAARRPSQVDRRLAQELVDRFVAAGAVKVFVGPRLGLHGPRRVVIPLVHHDDHLHLRVR